MLRQLLEAEGAGNEESGVGDSHSLPAKGAPRESELPGMEKEQGGSLRQGPGIGAIADKVRALAAVPPHTLSCITRGGGGGEKRVG